MDGSAKNFLEVLKNAELKILSETKKIFKSSKKNRT